jgi:YesN/AraC family two-component response regulator
MDYTSLELNQLQAARYAYLAEHVCDWSVNPRPFSTIAVMGKGDGRFVTPADTFEVVRGEAFFIPANSKYVSYWHGADEIYYYAIHFHFRNRHAAFSPQRFCLQKVDGLHPDAFMHHLDSISKYISRDGFERFKAYGAFFDLYADVLPLLRLSKTQNAAQDTVKDVIDFIESNCEKEFTVDDLAKLCHLSESRLYALFKQAMGCSPIAYRNSVRIRKAMTLLGEAYSIDEISAKVGFSSPVYFRQVFKKIIGKLPSEYKKNLWYG